ncbi:MAG: hypothetical protein JWO03_3368 [Bacteroidetes bacterium]|nr:hypothetical protein [Bacteroidota bacterium]
MSAYQVILSIVIFIACFFILKSIKAVFSTIWLYLPAFTIVCMLYAAMMAVGLGADIVIQSGEHFCPALASVLAILFWSFIVWYATRMVMYVRYRGVADPPLLIFQFPRFLGYHCFVAVQAAILALPSMADLSGWYIVAFIAAHSLYFILLTRAFDPAYADNAYRKISRYIAAAIGIGYIAFFIWLASTHSQYRSAGSPMRHTFWLPVEAIIVFVMQFFVLWGYMNRKEIAGLGPPQTRFFQAYRRYFISAAEWLCMDAATAESEWFYFLAFNVIGTGGFVVYILVILHLSWAGAIGAMAFALLAFSILIGFFSAISCLSMRLGVNLNIALIVVTVIMGLRVTNPHKVRTRPEAHYQHPIRIDTFFSQWLSQKGRMDSIKRGSYTAYIVLSDGGGSRAGTWVGKVMSHMQDQTESRFGDHLLVMSGASGGTIGNTSFYTLLRAQLDHKINDNFRKHIDTFYTADFLTYTAGRFLGPDFFRYLIPLPMDDRAAALEVAFESSGKDPIIDSYLQRSIDEVFDTTGVLPAFFINATEINGMPGYISRVNLRDKRINIKRLLSDTSGNRITMNMSTAAVLSSRFPYISPAGDIATLDFVDGGYFDNSGAGTAKSFMEGIYAAIDARHDSLLSANLRFQLVEIRNSAVITPESKAINPLVNDLFTPVVTLVGMQDASTKMGTYALTRYMRYMDHERRPLTIDLYDPKYKSTKPNNSDALEEDYPMSWVNSAYQLNRMDMRLNALEKDPNSEINQIELALGKRRVGP